MLKLLKKESLYSDIRVGYIVVTLIYALARQNITALQPYLMSDILNVAVIGAAGLLVLWDVVIFRNIWKTKYIWLLAAFGVLTAVSSVIGFRYGYVENVKSIANLFIQFCLLYVVSLRKERKGIQREVRIISDCIAAFWLIVVGISLFMYFADISYTQNRYLWGETTEIVQGFVHEHFGVKVMRLWGVFVDPNFASAVSIVVLCLSSYALITSKNRFQKIFHIVSVVFQFLYVVLSNSRMGLLIFCLIAFVGGWYYGFFLPSKKKRNIIVKEILAVILAVVCTGVCYSSVQLTKKVLPYVQYAVDVILPEREEPPVPSDETTTPPATEEPSTSEGATDEAPTQEPATDAPPEKGPQIDNLDRQDVVVKEDISNGRFSLWLEGLTTVFRQNMIFGVGPRNYHAVAKQIDPSMRISTGYSIHNSFVELLMGNGIIGAMVMILFLVLCAKDAIVVRYRDSSKAKDVGVLMLLALSVLACGMFIACLWYTLSGLTVIMFVALGYAIRLMRKDSQEEK